MSGEIIKYTLKNWNIELHKGTYSTSLYGFARDMSRDLPHSYLFGLTGIKSPQTISWGILGSKHIPKYVKHSIYLKIVEIKGKQNVRKGYE